MKNQVITIRRTHVDCSEIARQVRDKLLDLYGIRFKFFADTSICGRVSIEIGYSPAHMQDSEWYGRVQITSQIKLKTKDFK